MISPVSHNSWEMKSKTETLTHTTALLSTPLASQNRRDRNLGVPSENTRTLGLERTHLGWERCWGVRPEEREQHSLEERAWRNSSITGVGRTACSL